MFVSIFLLSIHLFIHSNFGLKPTDRLLLLIDMHKQTQSLHATKCKIRLSFSTVKEFHVKIGRLSKLITQGIKVIDRILNFPLLHTFLGYPRVFMFYFTLFLLSSSSRFWLQFLIFFMHFLEFFFLAFWYVDYFYPFY